MKRENGYYWVKINVGWRIFHWSDDCWYHIGGLATFQDDELQQINEQRLLNPDEHLDSPYKPITDKHRELLALSVNNNKHLAEFAANHFGKQLYYGNNGLNGTKPTAEGYKFVGNLVYATGELHQLYTKE